MAVVDLASPGAAADALIAALGSLIGRSVVLDLAEDLRGFTSTPGMESVILRDLAEEGDGSGGTFVLDASDAATADDGVDVIVDAVGGRWKRSRQNVGKGFVRLPGRERVRSLEDRLKQVAVDVCDFPGIDPSGANSSIDAAMAAAGEVAGYAGQDGKSGAFLLFPPNGSANGRYVFDSVFDLTRLRSGASVFAHGAAILVSGADNVGVDTFHSMKLQWHGGTIEADPSAVPVSGFQTGRILSGGSNPSSHHHRLYDLTIRGKFTRAALYNFASEELFAAGCHINNDIDDPDAYALVLDGQSGVFTPESPFENTGIGTPTGFAGNYFVKCSIQHISETGNNGSAVFIARGQNPRFESCLWQARKAPVFVIYDPAGSDRGIQKLYINGRAEGSSATALIEFRSAVGTEPVTHRGLLVDLDRAFEQRIFSVHPSVSDGTVNLKDLRLRIDNVFPGAANANPNGFVEIFADRAKFGVVTGELVINTMNESETGHVAVRGLDLTKFHGNIKVSDRAQIGSLPAAGSNYILRDDTDAAPIISFL